MKIYLGGDHAGFQLKENIKEYLPNLGFNYEVNDLGAYNYVEDDDYPDFIKKVAEEISKDKESFGIVFGGSGEGEAIYANKFKDIRACVFYGQKNPIKEINVKGEESNDPFEIIKLARLHNNANILSIGARFVEEDEAKFAIELFLSTKFSNEERHIRRLAKMI